MAGLQKVVRGLLSAAGLTLIGACATTPGAPAAIAGSWSTCAKVVTPGGCTDMSLSGSNSALAGTEFDGFEGRDVTSTVTGQYDRPNIRLVFVTGADTVGYTGIMSSATEMQLTADGSSTVSIVFDKGTN
jgi:hypothetical protein